MFFAKAEEIVKGKIWLKDRVAMKAITAGCDNVSDISDRKADFYTKLQYSYGIILDDRDTYYSKEDTEANLETAFSEEEKRDPETQFAVKIISHINKLRKNQPFYEYTEAGYFFITETWKVQDYSRKMVDLISSELNSEKKIVGYAISMSVITNILWYKLNKGFGNNDFPQNVNTVLKAKIALSNFISQNISRKFTECTEAYQRGELSNQQLAARLLALREKAMQPEDIDINNLEDSVNFDSKYIERFEAEYELHKAQIKKSNAQIEDYISEIEKLKQAIQMEEVLKELHAAEISEIIEVKEATIQAQNEELKKYREQEMKKENRQILLKKLGVLTVKIILRILVLLLVVFVAYAITKQVNAEAANTVSIVVTIAGFFITIVDMGKKAFKDILNNKE